MQPREAARDPLDSTKRLDPPARYEYRVLAPRLAGLRERLARSAVPVGREQRLETYLLGARADRSVKIRGAQLDIKALCERQEDLERWHPVARLELPVSGSWVRSVLARQLGLRVIGAPRTRYSEATLLSEVIAAQPELHGVRVRKSRQRFACGELLAEFTELELAGGDRLQSAAVECADRELAARWVRLLALDRWPNTSYSQGLKGFARKV